MKEFILASQSPRRKELFRNLIESFLIISPDIDESRENGENPEQHVERISARKAQAGRKLVNNSPGKDYVIVAADTIVVDGDTILGKPVDEEDATQMLLELRGRTHFVFSGFSVYDTSRDEVQTGTVSSKVLMREYTEDEVKVYVASGDPLDKAGAYAIQNQDFDPAPVFNDCFANVMGLPLCHLALLLKEMECPGHEDVADRCQSSIEYECPIFSSILSGTHGKE
jgi:MAF protein